MHGYHKKSDIGTRTYLAWTPSSYVNLQYSGTSQIHLTMTRAPWGFIRHTYLHWDPVNFILTFGEKGGWGEGG